MSLSVTISPRPSAPPEIRIYSPSAEVIATPQNSRKHSSSPEAGLPRRTQSLPVGTDLKGWCPYPEQVKRSATTAGLSYTERKRRMASPASRDSPRSPRPQVPLPTSKKSRTSAKDIDWTDIADPEERRRIQNRIAQRKFRKYLEGLLAFHHRLVINPFVGEKARETKERSERDSRNQEHAGNSYRIPSASDIDTESDLSGLPWGSLNLSHVVSRGHDVESRRSSGRGTYVGDEGYHLGSYPHQYGQGYPQTTSYGSSAAGEETFYDEAAYTYGTSGYYTPQ